MPRDMEPACHACVVEAVLEIGAAHRVVIDAVTDQLQQVLRQMPGQPHLGDGSPGRQVEQAHQCGITRFDSAICIGDENSDLGVVENGVIFLLVHLAQQSQLAFFVERRDQSACQRIDILGQPSDLAAGIAFRNCQAVAGGGIHAVQTIRHALDRPHYQPQHDGHNCHDDCGKLEPEQEADKADLLAYQTVEGLRIGVEDDLADHFLVIEGRPNLAHLAAMEGTVQIASGCVVAIAAHEFGGIAADLDAEDTAVLQQAVRHLLCQVLVLDEAGDADRALDRIEQFAEAGDRLLFRAFVGGKHRRTDEHHADKDAAADNGNYRKIDDALAPTRLLHGHRSGIENEHRHLFPGLAGEAPNPPAEALCSPHLAATPTCRACRAPFRDARRASRRHPEYAACGAESVPVE
ncbi:MAG: hypothetical protein Q8O52_20000 [Sulfuritalea sp.]|nr:hypothetical protein [Sulfuritalea sp.]